MQRNTKVEKKNHNQSPQGENEARYLCSSHTKVATSLL